MKALVCVLLLLETFVFVVQQQVDGGLNENEISQQISSEDGRQNPPQTDTLRAEASTDSQQNSHPCFSDIHAALRELTATVTEQKMINRELTATVTEQKGNIRELTATVTEQKGNIRELTATVTKQKTINRELIATVAEQKTNIRALEMRLIDAEKAAEQQTFLLEELNKKNDEISNLTQSQVEELRMENRDRQIAFSAGLLQSGSGDVGPSSTDIPLTYKKVFTNIGNAYNPITGIFTAPVKGAYVFTFNVYAHGQSNAASAYLMKNGQHVTMAHAHQAQGTLNSSRRVVLVLEVGDVVYDTSFDPEISDDDDEEEAEAWFQKMMQRFTEIQVDGQSPDIYAALKELTATVAALETRVRATEEAGEELKKKNDDREIAFSAGLLESGHEAVGPSATDITLIYKKVFTNIGNAYNPVTGIFTAPVKGAYVFKVSVYHYGQSIPAAAYIMKNEKSMILAYAHQAQGTLNSSKGVVLVLEVGDVVYVRLWPNGCIHDNENHHNTFSGYMLFPLK
ncbi:Complement C1q tumor necrosis factor-related protein 3 [Anabarilius grahami]|uniref:Complement C1q tumor necrosis factor-related protein 3 n=1 Tax=Anabarilius grahami TaxID=495550 RepID=A0A3N0Z685_ANAGA|nr:Complement C1q tumor necrosis factor-related protein 3 [Anabarilius grahami]